MFNIMHTDGSGEVNPPVETLPKLYDELLSVAPEHGDVSVVHEGSEWCLSAHRDGRLVLEHLRTRGSERHMIPIPKERVLELWRRLINGDIDSLLSEPWEPGYKEKAVGNQ